MQSEFLQDVLVTNDELHDAFLGLAEEIQAGVLVLDSFHSNPSERMRHKRVATGITSPNVLNKSECGSWSLKLPGSDERENDKPAQGNFCEDASTLEKKSSADDKDCEIDKVCL